MSTTVTTAVIAATSEVAGWAAALAAGGALLVIGLLVALELLGTSDRPFQVGLRSALRVAVSPLLVVFVISISAKTLAILGS